MGLRDENVLGLIENISSFLNTILFTGLNLNVKEYENFEEFLELKLELKKYIEKKQFKLAEEKLFENLKLQNKSHEVLRVTFWFYLKLNEFDDETLEKGGVKRDEIVDGLKKIEECLIGDI